MQPATTFDEVTFANKYKRIQTPQRHADRTTKQPKIMRIKHSQRFGLLIAIFSVIFLLVTIRVSDRVILCTSNYDHEAVVKFEPTSTTTGEECRLLPENEAPIPVILMADGRTGSSITWMTISRMTGFPNVAFEYTGQQQEKTIAFFDSIQPEVGSHFAVNQLCKLQHDAKDKVKQGEGIVGFQWKPIHYGLSHEYGIGALQEIATHVDPVIRVIHLTRNPLDRLISNRKHISSSKTNKKIEAHCADGDEECIKEHARSHSGTILPTGKELIKSLQNGLRHDIMVADILGTRGIKHIRVDYDRLYSGEYSGEWLRIFKFLGRGPQEELTMKEVRSNFDLAATSSKQHKDKIGNFDEVWKTLNGTDLACLVH